MCKRTRGSEEWKDAGLNEYTVPCESIGPKDFLTYRHISGFKLKDNYVHRFIMSEFRI